MKRKSALEMCLRHSITEVMKYNILMHSYTPFLQWPFINIVNNDFTELNRGQRQYEPNERNLIANFENERHFSFDNGWNHWNLLQRRLITNTRLCNLHVNNANFLNSIYSLPWRRVFADNFIDFSCTDSDIASYVEHTERIKPVHVFKEITKREMGETFNLFRILESIASPYYYILPHHREGSYDRMNNIIENWRLRYPSNPYPGDDIFCFESRIRIARKNVAHFEEIVH
ncbi:uncharacterized protein TNCT_462631 [Trichonephila clavata]|uniref:Uncharacterized protein n=1 Tax=Trichonephila clavata TaxID=2740835 RepID=A0A8X6LCW4_TRICU|nr:uncharacterized protein TNCT_462631 [Trichonephila clavata]